MTDEQRKKFTESTDKAGRTVVKSNRTGREYSIESKDDKKVINEDGGFGLVDSIDSNDNPFFKIESMDAQHPDLLRD